MFYDIPISGQFNVYMALEAVPCGLVPLGKDNREDNKIINEISLLDAAGNVKHLLHDNEN